MQKKKATGAAAAPQNVLGELNEMLKSGNVRGGLALLETNRSSRRPRDNGDGTLRSDPILAAIKAYRDGSKVFDALPNEYTENNQHQAIEETYGPPMQVLNEWDLPANTIEGALAALNLVKDDVFLEDFGMPLLEAAIGFLQHAMASHHFLANENAIPASSATPGQVMQTVSAETAVTAIKSDSLANTIQAYRDGLAEYEALDTADDEDELAMETYKVHSDALDEWHEPAQTLRGALEALKLISDLDIFEDVMGEPLLKAAIGYLEGVSARHSTLSEAAAPQDRLYDAIGAYRKGSEAFDAIPCEQITPENEERLICETYGAAQEVLENWDRPAETAKGALEAMRVISERAIFEDLMGEPLCHAVLGYLEGKDAARLGPKVVDQANSSFLEMFNQWTDIRNDSFAGLSEEEYMVIYERYTDLQARIVEASPLTPKDVAIQLFVATDGFESLTTEKFKNKIHMLLAA